MDFKHTLDTLPSSWSELKLSAFMKLTDINIVEQDENDNLFVGVDNTIRVISVLGNVTVDELEALPLNKLQKLASKVSFITSTEPDLKKKTHIKWKNLNELTYSDFVTFQQFQTNPFPHLHLILKGFAKTEMSEEQILELDTETALGGFFFCSKECEKICEQYHPVLGSESKDANDERMAPTLQDELQSVKKDIFKTYGWHFTAKQVADWTRISFYDVFEKTAIEILSTVLVMQQLGEYNTIGKNQTHNNAT